MVDSSAEETKRDDYERFVRLLMANEADVRSYLRALLPSWQAVEEVAQEASLVAWRKFGELKEDGAFGGWLLTIARFEALKYRRRAARSPLVFTDELWDLLAKEVDETIQQNNQQSRRELLERCLEELPPSKRDILLKVYSSDLAMKEVAKQIGKSEQAFYKLIQRLRGALLDCMTRAMEGA